MDRLKLDHLTTDSPVDRPKSKWLYVETDRQQLNKENAYPGTKLWAVNPKSSKGLSAIIRGGLQHFPDSWRREWEKRGLLNPHKVGG